VGSSREVLALFFIAGSFLLSYIYSLLIIFSANFWEHMDSGE
jgi:hypothetical protein